MSLRQSFLTKRYSTSTVVHTCAWYIWATVYQSQHEVYKCYVDQKYDVIIPYTHNTAHVVILPLEIIHYTIRLSWR